MPLDRDEMREYQRARRAREREMKALGQDKPPVPGEAEGLSPTYVTPTSNVVQLVDTLKRRRGRPSLEQDGLATAIANLPPEARDAVLEGIRTQSPAWLKYLASRGK